MKKFIVSLIIAPLFVAIIAATYQYALPEIFKKSKELSYFIAEPVSHLPSDGTDTLDVVVNSVKTKRLYGQKVKLWNSGKIALKNLSVLFVFDTNDPSFKIFNISLVTTPKEEFGKIIKETTILYRRRFTFELLNENNEASLTFLTNNLCPLRVFSKQENMKLIVASSSEISERRISQKYKTIAIISGSLATSLVYFSFVMVSLRRKWLLKKNVQNYIEKFSKVK